ncbi:probable methyltransferase-like protein 17, mitochondrial at N-terminal half [Coccomyxa sp. Obi]|nr:probable methyltransferase-like protein 17, mitochondrial at N-terminal half [Coccomyxa sp. Obi]
MQQSCSRTIDRVHALLVDLLPNIHLLRSFSTTTLVSIGAVHELPIEAATAVSRRNHGVVTFPNSVEDVISNAIGTGRKGSLRHRSAGLLQELRLLSRSVSRGGQQVLQPLNDLIGEIDAPSPKKAQRKKQDMWDQKVQSLLNTSSMLNLEEAMQTAQPEVTEWPSQPRRSTSSQQEKRSRQLQYDDNQATAYVAARMPGCYAAIYNIMDELSVRLPSFHPQSMLDFGSGPGTAVWAAQEIWHTSLYDVLAVEPSTAMAALGQRIQSARHSIAEDSAQGSQQAQVRWVYRLPWYAMKASSHGARGKKRATAESRKYDIVTSAYVLGELESEQERRDIVNTLWACTKDLLVLVEPGTPAGSANILEARRQVLEASMQEAIGEMGAHVVAPCPHDGLCPMKGTGSWCHFSQRFQRSNLQRIIKIRPDGGLARTYQDERYSYVVIRKEPRPQVKPALSISRHRQDSEEQDSYTPYLPPPRSWRKSESKMRQAAALQQVIDEMKAIEDPVEEGESLEETTEWLIRQSMGAGYDEDEDIGEDADNGAEDHQPRASSFQIEGRATGVQEADDVKEETPQHPPQVYTSRDDGGSVTSETGGDESRRGSGHALAGTGPEVEASAALDTGELDLDSKADDEEVSSHVAAAAAADSMSWGRIIRHPRKRNKHIIFDVCTARASILVDQRSQVDQDVSSSRPAQANRMLGQGRKDCRQLGEEGVLVRQVVASSDKRAWLGPAGYRLARKARWGDLWPTHYANRALAIVTRAGSTREPRVRQHG